MMGDIICRVCGEPWDAFGVHSRTDVTEREAKQILSGRGCPSCKGKQQLHTHQIEFLQSMDDNTDRDVFEVIEENE